MDFYLDEYKLNDPSNRRYVNDPVEGIAGLPGIRTSEGVNVGQDGQWTSAQKYDARFIAIPVSLYGQDAQEVEIKRRELMTILRRKNLTLRIVTIGGFTYTTEVVVMGATSPITKVITKFDVKINLKADDPKFFDDTSGELLAVIPKTKEGGFEIPFELPLEIDPSSSPVNVINTGNEIVSPFIEITTESTNPQIINRTTGQFIKIETTIEDGSELLIDMKQETVILDGLNIYGLKSAGSDFWKLMPGDNLIELITDVPSENSEAELYYRSGFIGI